MIKSILSVSFVLLCALQLTVFAAQPAGPAVAGFELQDFLGRQWQNESVRFPLSSGQLKSAQARRALVGRDDRPVPYQIVSNATSATSMIEFVADLELYETRTYRFTQAVKPAAGIGHCSSAARRAGSACPSAILPRRRKLYWLLRSDMAPKASDWQTTDLHISKR